MNNSVYIFGNLSNGYTQYPYENFSAAIFQKFYTKVKATTQIAIHRDGNLMYYAYIRCIEQNKYIGLCVVLNNLMITKFDRIFLLYENVISNLVAKGHLIKFNERGDLIPNTEKLYMNVEEVELVTESLKAGFDSLISDARTLPPVNYSTSSDSTKDFSVEDPEEEILKSSHNNGFTYIYKSKNFNTAQLDSYKSVLSRVNETNLSLRKENKELQEKNQEILRQKKQFKNVVLLIFVVIGCGIGIFFLYDNLNNTQGQLDAANNTIVEKNSVIDSKDNRISNLNNSIDSLQNEYNKEHNRKVEIEERLTKVCGSNPFVVTSCNVGSEEFSFDYYADEEKDVTVTLKAINEKNSEIVSNSHSITVTKGIGSMKLYFDHKLSGSDYYYVVLMYDGHIIAGKRW